MLTGEKRGCDRCFDGDELREREHPIEGEREQGKKGKRTNENMREQMKIRFKFFLKASNLCFQNLINFDFKLKK